MLRFYRIRPHERGLLYRDGVFQGVLEPGRHVRFDPLLRLSIRISSVRGPWLVADDLDVIVRSGALERRALVLDLKDHERALVWVDGRFEAILGPGLHALWTLYRDVRAEVIDARTPRFEHAELERITASSKAVGHLDVFHVETAQEGVLLVEGRAVGVLEPGRYAFWKGVKRVQVRMVDRREQVLDVAGQELMTADKVTIRVNALVVLKVVDALRSCTVADDARQAVYREVQLALRAVVGTRELDPLLAEKESLSSEVERLVKERAQALGLELVRVGVKDLILPGEMKELMNQVTQAKKAAEAALITRREETAAMRSQANTAKLLESSPTLMRLRELEVLEKVAQKANLTVVLGEQKLTDRVVKLL